MSYRKRALAIVSLVGALAAGNAAASEFSGSVTLTNNYLFRGITQTDDEPAIQGGFEWSHASGFYAGAWGSSISWLADSDPDISSQAEIDGYVGFRGDFGESGFGWDLGALYYWYPGSYPAGFNDADTTEVYVGLSWEFLTAKYSYAVTDLFGLPDSDGSSALDLGASWEFAPTWTLDGKVGKQWVENSTGADYAYWSVGVGKSFENGFALAAAYNDNDLVGPDETWTFAISKSF